ncbi:MAG: 2-isopropylmalate synthase [Armatimonadetes bacterium CG07_land_8_20_14_0_80_40_9]|nr:MAG: 2-isopropylmalate synthase [Armatimonadetes bacterium CG07_land_8_20_14_0_80_40_9]
MTEKIKIFDTTLRDGEQSPGASLNIEEKLKVAKQLAKLNVDIIEAGFPISSAGDFEAVKLIAKTISGPIICGLSRTAPKDIDRSWEAIKFSKKPRIHTFIATSDIHLKTKLKKSKKEVLDLAVKAVRRAKRYTEDVEFSPEDAARSDPLYLYQIIKAVIEAGATTVNIPDTVGYSTPFEFGELIAEIKENVKNISRATISVHCHNDLGMATANSLSAVKNGARQVECTINGIGERAGNTSLEEIVMSLHTRRAFFGMKTGINTQEIYPTSRLVSALTGIPVQPNKAIVGKNAFAHEAGIHQDGILKGRRTYEIMTPQSIGLRMSKLVMGKHSGRHAFQVHLRKMGYKLDNNDLEKAFLRFKDLADKKKEVLDEDLVMIVEEGIFAGPETYSLEYLHISSGNKTVPTATVKLSLNKRLIQEAACGDGPVDAVCQAINRIVGVNPKLLEYSLKAVTGGTEALGEVTVKIKAGKDIFLGRGTSTDIVEASAKAYLNAINKVVYRKKKVKPR